MFSTSIKILVYDSVSRDIFSNVYWCRSFVAIVLKTAMLHEMFDIDPHFQDYFKIFYRPSNIVMGTLINIYDRVSKDILFKKCFSKDILPLLY